MGGQNKSEQHSILRDKIKQIRGDVLYLRTALSDVLK